MADEPQTPGNKRYSLRVRTPAKPTQPEVVATPAPRKRARKPTSSSRKTGRVTTPSRGRGRGRASNRASSRARNVAHEETSEESSDEMESLDEEVEDFGRNKDPEANYVDEEESEQPQRRGPGRPRKSMEPNTARRSWEVRRIPVHLTKHDPFCEEYLEQVARILGKIPVNELANGERYELMKMADALKMCGYELGVADEDTESIQQVYRLLSWSVHEAGPGGITQLPPPPLSDAAKTVLLKVFASIGRRIREETRDMAGYHRRHALRKLILADGMDSSIDDESMPGTPISPKGVAHRRNPLRIPGPLIDIWKEPYKRTMGSRNSADHESQVFDD
ncbi:hypothetical protein LPJ78_002433 [Coemansia sp. RSA 989]|nr:hypothetical protein BX667DRAFT_508761 [Coemansia mojavensis]KAJ1748313.1 hypothetical protein LPJ79_004631 [Coemansia sp. RSA 1821]KAJ1865745.1 hypothetical protein LPJ78_002433 [Coemansia sp. RSA 989]KAJ1873666.1 hypothetical protein LPJ55_002117 [Coemansia sp. RSA 990]KAJ2671427.1 hypothetical protein IWW42_003386 [Coemansia sp. RSA 1085]